MAQNMEELVISLQADLSGIRSQMNQLGSMGQAAGSEVNKGFSGIPKLFSAIGTVAISAFAGVATAIGGATTAIGIMSNELQQAQGKIQAMTGMTAKEARKAGDVVLAVYRDAWGESIDQLSNDYSKLKAALGSVDKKTLESAQILQKSFEGADIDSVSRALKQMKTYFPGKSEAQLMDMITVAFQKTGDTSGDYQLIGLPA